MTDQVVEFVLPRPTIDPAVRIVWHDAGTIAQILVSGRPRPCPYAGEGNHFTAWAVYGDLVRRQLIGLDLAGARTRLGELIEEEHTTDARDRFLVGERRSRFFGAGTRCRTALAAAVGPTGPVQLNLAVAAYLSCRQYGPMASIWLDVGQAIGAAEAASLDTLRRFEANTGGVTNADARDAIFRLLDRSGVRWIGTDGALGNAPGRGTLNRPGLVTDIVVRHMAAISLAYPRAYRRANAPAGIAGFLTGIDGTVQWPDAWGDVPAVGGIDDTAAPADWSLGSATGTVVGLTPNAGGTAITGITVGARYRTLLTSGQGHHLTAYVVLQSLLIRRLVQNNLATSRARLVALVAELDALPTLPPLAQGTRALPFIEDRNGIFAATWEALAAARDSLADAQDPAAIFDSLAETAAAYLCVRNALPLAALARGGPAGYAGERDPRELLDEVEDDGDGATPDEIHRAMWKLLFIEGAAECYENKTPGDRRHMAPGAPDGARERLSAVLRVHRLTMRATWPTAYGRCQFDSRTALRAMFVQAGLPQLEFDAVAVSAGYDRVGLDLRPLEEPRPLKMDDVKEGAYTEPKNKRKGMAEPTVAPGDGPKRPRRAGKGVFTGDYSYTGPEFEDR